MQFIGGDPDKDVAVLQLQCPPEKQEELVPITVGSSANLLVGQKVFALGNPFGLDHSMTQVCAWALADSPTGLCRSQPPHSSASEAVACSSVRLPCFKIGDSI